MYSRILTHILVVFNGNFKKLDEEQLKAKTSCLIFRFQSVKESLWVSFHAMKYLNSDACVSPFWLKLNKERETDREQVCDQYMYTTVEKLRIKNWSKVETKRRGEDG